MLDSACGSKTREPLLLLPLLLDKVFSPLPECERCIASEPKLNSDAACGRRPARATTATDEDEAAAPGTGEDDTALELPPPPPPLLQSIGCGDERRELRLPLLPELEKLALLPRVRALSRTRCCSARMSHSA